MPPNILTVRGTRRKKVDFRKYLKSKANLKLIFVCKMDIADSSQLTLYDTGCTKSIDKNEYCLITFKIELCRNFPFVYSFFIPYSPWLFHKIKDNFKFINTIPETLRNIHLKWAASSASQMLTNHSSHRLANHRAAWRLHLFCWGVMRFCVWLNLSIDSTDNPWPHRCYSSRVVDI